MNSWTRFWEKLSQECSGTALCFSRNRYPTTRTSGTLTWSVRRRSTSTGVTWTARATSASAVWRSRTRAKNTSSSETDNSSLATTPKYLSPQTLTYFRSKFPTFSSASSGWSTPLKLISKTKKINSHANWTWVPRWAASTLQYNRLSDHFRADIL